MIVVDEDTCMVEFSKFFLNFAQAESCGKCIPCRVGGRRLLEILTRITEGRGRLEDLATIKEIAQGMQNGSLCALGQLTRDRSCRPCSTLKTSFRPISWTRPVRPGPARTWSGRAA